MTHRFRISGPILVAVSIGLVPAAAWAQAVTPLDVLADLSRSIGDLSERLSPAVVQIIATSETLADGTPSTEALIARNRTSGSGVIVDPAGYIVTNNHVVEGARRIQVSIAELSPDPRGGRSIVRPRARTIGAQVVGLDRETDLAVLKIQESNLAFARLGDSDLVRQGQLVLALGSPLGLENTATLGIVSSVVRQLRPDDPMIYIQTDASINPGSSGGPLVTPDGQVIGINTSIFSRSGGSEGIGFAAPSNVVRTVYEQIRAYGHVRRGEIGVRAQTITLLMAQGLGLPRPWGVILGDVYPGSPAEAAGLRPGDLIDRMDGKTMENGRQFDVNLYRRTIGDLVELDVLRGAERLRIEVPVVERPRDPNRLMALVSQERNLVARLGILGIDLDADVARLFPSLRRATGVVIAAQSQNAPAGRGAFRPGDVLYAINGARVDDLRGLRESLAALNAYDPVVMHVEREGELLYVVFELE